MVKTCWIKAASSSDTDLIPVNFKPQLVLGANCGFVLRGSDYQPDCGCVEYSPLCPLL